jgi:hypothetical protein
LDWIEIGAKGMSVATLAKLSAVLNVSSDYILFGRVSTVEKQSRLIAMLDNIPSEKQKYVADLLRLFLQAIE